MQKQTIHCKRILTLRGWRQNVLLEIEPDGLISRVKQGADDHVDFHLRGPVIPGMPNCHSHSFQRQMAGLAGKPGPDQSDSFWSWRERMYQLANALDAEAIEAIALWLFVEMLEAGYTSCAEFHYLHHRPDGEPYPQPGELGNRIFKAGSEAGIALTLLPTLYCRAGFDSERVSPAQRRFFNDPDRFLSVFKDNLDFSQQDPLCRVGLGFHSLRAVTRDQMHRVLEAASDEAAAIHIHIAEQPAEVAQCLEAYGKRPVAWLLDNAPVDDRWCLVHATHMSPEECELLIQRGAVAGLCPTTEADLGDGFFDAGHWVQNDAPLSIGSDSNLRVCPAEELRLLEFGLRLRTGQRNVLSTKGRECGLSIYDAAARGGAAALGQPVGGLAEGFRADLVELDENHPLLQGVADEDIVDRYVFAGDKGMIASVFVAGQQQVHQGKHKLRDTAARGFEAVMKEMRK